MNDDRYLWDGSGPADPEVERLEVLLGRFRHDGPAPAWERRRPGMRVLAVAAVLALAAAGALFVARAGAGWSVRKIAGAPAVQSAAISGSGLLSAGQLLETDASSRARLDLSSVGRVEVGPNSRVRLLRSRWTEQRLALDRGAITAKIWAPPRLFLVETPSALAVDLGCEYALEVNDAGAGLLRVTTGWVSFEREGRESIVPAGAACATRPSSGPGTPYYEDASPEFLRALESLDSLKGDEDSLKVVLAAARKRDGLSLWHLLPRTEGPARERVYERLAALVPPPAGVTREGALALEERMLDRWRWELDGMPWLPRNASVGSFFRKLWFRIAGD